MGQDVFHPPTVGGWDGDRAWITSQTLATRYNSGRKLLGDDDPGWMRELELLGRMARGRDQQMMMTEDTDRPALSEIAHDALTSGALGPVTGSPENVVRAKALVEQGRQLVQQYEEIMRELASMKVADGDARPAVEVLPATPHPLAGPAVESYSWEEQKAHAMRCDAQRAWKNAMTAFHEANKLAGEGFGDGNAALADAYFCRFADCAATLKVASDAFRRHVERYDTAGRYT